MMISFQALSPSGKQCLARHQFDLLTNFLNALLKGKSFQYSQYFKNWILILLYNGD